jgi:hypothetical protein
MIKSLNEKNWKLEIENKAKRLEENKVAMEIKFLKEFK